MSTQTATLADFLLARITEDEAMAQAAAEVAAPPWKWRNQLGPHKYGLIGRHPVQPGLSAWVVPSASPDVYPHRDTAAHLERWDPARVLAECKAKRAIVEQIKQMDFVSPGPMLRVLAVVYSDHPDYRAEWVA